MKFHIWIYVPLNYTDLSKNNTIALTNPLEQTLQLSGAFLCF